MKKYILFIFFLILLITLISCKKNSIPSEPEYPTETPVSADTATVTATPTATVFDHISITAPNGQDIADQVAGVPFTVSITAWNDPGETQVCTAFNGYINITSSHTKNSYEYVCWPTQVSFTTGFNLTDITIYKSSEDNESLIAQFAYSQYHSNEFIIAHSGPSRFLILVDGMTHEPGLVKVGIPGYYGYSGAPKPVYPGHPFTITALLVDDYYNRVTGTATTDATITSDDLLASVNGLSCNPGASISLVRGEAVITDAILNTFIPGYSETHTFSIGNGYYSADETPSIRIMEP